jgi:hypothetical protein
MTDDRVLLILAGVRVRPTLASTLAQVWDPVSGAQRLESLVVR